MRPLNEPTAGALSLKASGDRQVYDPLEIAYGMTDKVMQGVAECIETHENLIGEDEFFVVLQRASDPLLQNIMRQKFYADLFMPEPRPEQMVCLYKKRDQSVTRLWSLPNAKVMAVISEMAWVDQKWVETKYWCDAFFSGKFFERIRDQHKISHLSKKEFLEVNREKLMKLKADDIDSPFAKSRNRFEITVDEIVDPADASAS